MGRQQLAHVFQGVQKRIRSLLAVWRRRPLRHHRGWPPEDPSAGRDDYLHQPRVVGQHRRLAGAVGVRITGALQLRRRPPGTAALLITTELRSRLWHRLTSTTRGGLTQCPRRKKTRTYLRSSGCMPPGPYRGTNSRRGRLRSKPRCRSDDPDSGLLHRLIGTLKRSGWWPSLVNA